jgi:hypothetical protein
VFVGKLRTAGLSTRRCAGGSDPATEHLAITALADEEEHRREFVGFLKEVERGRLGQRSAGRRVIRWTRAARETPR